MDRAVARARGSAEWVRVRESTIEHAGLGLFVALPPGTTRATDASDRTDYGIDSRGVCVVTKGSFAGLYRGEFKRRTTQRPYGGARKSHAMETEDFFIVPRRPAASTNLLVDVYEYRVAAVQEVPGLRGPSALAAMALSCSNAEAAIGGKVRPLVSSFVDAAHCGQHGEAEARSDRVAAP